MRAELIAAGRTPKDSIQGKPISDILVDDKDAFQRAIDVMKNDDSRSYKLRLTVAMGSLSTLSSEYSAQNTSTPELGQFEMEEVKEERPTLTLEGQGILIYDRATGNPSHVRLPFIAKLQLGWTTANVTRLCG